MALLPGQLTGPLIMALLPGQLTRPLIMAELPASCGVSRNTPTPAVRRPMINNDAEPVGNRPGHREQHPSATPGHRALTAGGIVDGRRPRSLIPGAAARE